MIETIYWPTQEEWLELDDIRSKIDEDAAYEKENAPWWNGCRWVG